MQKIYHIYAKKKCLFHTLSEEEFTLIWKALNGLIEIIDTEYESKDLTYEELVVNKSVVLESSH